MRFDAINPPISEMPQRAAQRERCDDFISATINNRINHAADEMARSLNMCLYGGARRAVKSLTARERFMWRVNICGERIRDAWLVLTGKETIGGDY